MGKDISDEELYDGLSEEQKKFLDSVISGYRQEINELARIRRENAEKHSQMTQEELAESLEKEYAEVLESAKEEGVTVAVIPKHKDKK